MNKISSDTLLEVNSLASLEDRKRESLGEQDTTVHVSAILPCLNEERTLGICIQKIQEAFVEANIRGEVVVGDNGSTDSSKSLALELGAIVVDEPVPGYGAALQAAASAARGKFIVMADADDSYDWSTIMDFVAELEAGAEVVIGNRFRGGIDSGAMPPLHRYFGKDRKSVV